MTETYQCDVCQKVASIASHPCQFEKACDCWRGTACIAVARKKRATPNRNRS